MIGYSYSKDLNSIFSVPFIFDEEFVIMFAMFLVIGILISYTLTSFSLFFSERIDQLNKFFIDIFDYLFNNLTNLLTIFNKLNLMFQFNTSVLKISIENILFILNELEFSQYNFLKFFLEFSKFKVSFFTSCINLIFKIK
jgi:hypothetical protein